jgi:hypothetical protein
MKKKTLSNKKQIIEIDKSIAFWENWVKEESPIERNPAIARHWISYYRLKRAEITSLIGK